MMVDREIVDCFLKAKVKKDNIILKQLKKTENINKLTMSYKKVILFGAGKVGQRTARILDEINLEVYAFVDNNIAAGNVVCGVPVLSFEQLLENKDNYIWYITVKNIAQKNEILEQLEEKGIVNIALSLEELLFCHYLKQYEFEDELYQSGEKLILFGAGKYGARYVSQLKKIGIDIYCIVDNNSIKAGNTIDNIPICRLDQIKLDNEKIIWFTSVKSEETKIEIENCLKKCGYSRVVKSIKELLTTLDRCELMPFFEETVSKKSNLVVENQSQEEPQMEVQVDWNGRGADILRSQREEYTVFQKLHMLEECNYRPLISIIVPMYNPPMKWLPRVVECLQEQIYSNWELCIADDGSPCADGRDYIAEQAKKDSRIRLVLCEKNGGISAASNIALSIAKGEFIALLDQDDEIPDDALFWVALALNEDPQLDFLYTDECKLNSLSKLKFFDFYFKPNWSPRLLMNHMYTGHLSIYRTALVKEVGGFRSKYDFSQDYDLALRISKRTNKIKHIERVLYYWRAIETSAATGAKDFARVSNMNALKSWYDAQGIDTVMQMMPRGNYGRVNSKDLKRVSIIIPSDNLDNQINVIHGLMEKTSYTNIEIIPVTNAIMAKDLEKEFVYLGRTLKICEYNDEFNFSKKCNLGAKIASGDVLLFYNDDVFPISNDWIEKMLDLLIFKDVGSVSPMLVGVDGRIQYAGMFTGVPGLVGTVFNGYQSEIFNYAVFNHFLLRDVSVFSGACVAIRKDVYWEVGGFDAINTPNGHSDVDLSFRLMEAGYYNTYTPYAKLIHLGNHTWHPKEDQDLSDIYCMKRWGKYLTEDAFFTHSMKKMFYTDFNYVYKLFVPLSVKNNSNNNKNILFISHELSLTGAPVVLINAVKSALKAGYFPVVLSFQDGPLKETYEKMGVIVIVDESVRYCDWILKRFIRNFDIVFANTIVSYPVIELLKDEIPKVYWWLHEGEYAIKVYKDLLPKTLGRKVDVLYGGEYVKQSLEKYGFRYNGKNMFYCVESECFKEKKKEVDNFHFLYVASFEKRKGPDIFMQAIISLPKEIFDRCEFIFIGANFDDVLTRSLKEKAQLYSNIKVLDPILHDELGEYYRWADAIVVPSRDDPCPVVAVEAMVQCVPVICTNKTGTSYFIQDGKNGFVFESENSHELSELIVEIVQNGKDMLYKVGEQGHKIFEKNFSVRILEEKMNNLLQRRDL
ncbi:MAG: glycosyltransferase [Clostridiaceae bacterium]|nr:glycosyltransferase [Clostridiaceae bacterium]